LNLFSSGDIRFDAVQIYVSSPGGSLFMKSRYTALLACVVCAASLASVFAAPVTTERISRLPAAEQKAWKAYWERSHANALADGSVLQKEVASLKLTTALAAPSGGDFKVPAKVDKAWFGQEEAKRLTDVILSFQTPSGGWSKHSGFDKGPRRPGMQFSSQYEPGKPPHYLSTFDNRSTTEEMQFLAVVWNATRREDCKMAFIKGLDFILAAQFPNGGWPQVYPLEGAYHDDVTFNDDAMTHVLELLQAIARNEPNYGFLDDAQREKAAAALERGVQSVLNCQIRQGTNRTVWCAQFDPITLQPSSARNMEPASLSGVESSHVLLFLMSITNPSPDVVIAIESGLHWFEAAEIKGETKTSADGKQYFEPNAAGNQVRWARFYNLTNNQPEFPGRDGVIYNSFAEMAAKNKLGYDYFSSLPGSIVGNGQSKWRKMLNEPKKKKQSE
jgi:PelA/Pel-15E family pectate lyase